MPEAKTTPDYLGAAKANLNEANKTYSAEQFAGHIAAAQAQATVALAEEQRTANLIALQQLWLAEGAGPSESVGALIAERLGLA
jgi:hypothetical protein